jgi:hypothetical protein
MIGKGVEREGSESAWTGIAAIASNPLSDFAVVLIARNTG